MIGPGPAEVTRRTTGETPRRDLRHTPADERRIV
jgi:hypothetical protein